MNRNRYYILKYYILYTLLLMPFDVTSLRAQFPILSTSVNGKPLMYLDSAATSQKPLSVVRAMHTFYETQNANINRGVHPLTELASTAYDNARNTVRAFLNAPQSHEIIFTRNATEGINLVARSFGRAMKPESTVALTLMEHHSNIVPWQMLAERSQIRLEWIGIDTDGTLDTSALKKILEKGSSALLAITGLSNVLGVAPDLKKIIALAHKHGTRVLIDAAQLAAHEHIDVQALDCDFLVFSGHKIYGPTGIGVLYGKSELLHAMPPFLGGGDMIQNVTTVGFTPAELPRKFEAGTPAIAEAVGLSAAIQWLQSLDRTAVKEHEASLIKHALEHLESIKGLNILGSHHPEHHHAVISFTIDGIHPHDLTDILGSEGFCLRAGHHCTQPLHQSLGINASTRLSVAAYNTIEEVDRCIEAMKEAQKILKK